MRTEEMSLAKIFNFETVAAICCPQVNNLSGGVESRHAHCETRSSEQSIGSISQGAKGSDLPRTINRCDEGQVSGSSAPPAQNTCPTCDGQGTVDYPGATDGTQMDCTNPNCRDFEREE